MTLNVKGRNIEINDTLAAAYKEAVFLDMAEIDVLAYLEQEYHVSHLEKIIATLTDSQLKEIIERQMYMDVKFHMEELLCQEMPETLKALYE